VSSDWRWSKEGCWVSIPGNVLSWAVSATSCRSATFAGTRMPSKHWGGSGDVFGLWRVCHWWRVLPARGEEGRLPAPVLLASLGALGSIGVVDGRSMMLSRLASVDDDLRSQQAFVSNARMVLHQARLGGSLDFDLERSAQVIGLFFCPLQGSMVFVVFLFLVGGLRAHTAIDIFHGYLFTPGPTPREKRKRPTCALLSGATAPGRAHRGQYNRTWTRSLSVADGSACHLA
jgi:hypothetical protein